MKGYTRRKDTERTNPRGLHNWRMPNHSPLATAFRKDGKFCYARQCYAIGAYREFDTAAECLLSYIEEEIGAPVYGHRMFMMESLGIPSASFSRARSGVHPIMDHWLLRLMRYSGIPLEELMKVAFMEESHFVHQNARKS